MSTCAVLRKDHLTNPVLINTNGQGLGYNKAKRLADEEASRFSSDAMLLAWFERETGRFSPNVECCGEDKPSWVIYAESRGGNLTIDIDDESYVFIYLCQ